MSLARTDRICGRKRRDTRHWNGRFGPESNNREMVRGPLRPGSWAKGVFCSFTATNVSEGFPEKGGSHVSAKK